jgi:hypothetical protein
LVLLLATLPKEGKCFQQENKERQQMIIAFYYGLKYAAPQWLGCILAPVLRGILTAAARWQFFYEIKSGQRTAESLPTRNTCE